MVDFTVTVDRAATFRRRWVSDRFAELASRFPGVKAAVRPLYRRVRGLRLQPLLAANASLKDLHEGRRCIVLGNGVSLNDHSLPSFNQEFTFGCNEVFSHPDFHRLNLSFYAMVEPYYGALLGRRYLTDVLGLYKDITKAFGDLETRLFFDASVARPLTRHGLLTGNRRFYLLSGRPIDAAPPMPIDLTRPIPFLSGAVFAMIAAAVYMGFKDIYLLGCGYTYHPMQHYHFNARPTFHRGDHSLHQIQAFARRNGLDVQSIEERDDVLAPIFTRSIRDEGLDRKHRITDEYARRTGVSIWNVTPEGFESPIYRRLSRAEFLERLQQ